MKSGKVCRKNGGVSIVIIAITTMFIIMFILMFSICIMYINMYSIVYNYKMDLYNLNRNAILSVNKVEGKYGIYSYNKDKYMNQFKDLLVKTYNLNENLQNGDKFIKQIKILEYNIYTQGNIDSITNKVILNDTIHIVTSITYEPIIFKNIFTEDCTFTVHNDISIKMYD